MPDWSCDCSFYSTKFNNTEDPVLIRFDSKEPHSIINEMDSDLYFLAFYVPPFEPGETELLGQSFNINDLLYDIFNSP